MSQGIIGINKQPKKQFGTRYFLKQNNSNSPVPYSASKAASWKAAYSRQGISKEDESAWFQPYVVSLSLAGFLVYFGILREENDIDILLQKSLYDRIDGLEEMQLKEILNFNIENGKDATEIISRLNEIEKAKLKGNYCKNSN